MCNPVVLERPIHGLVPARKNWVVLNNVLKVVSQSLDLDVVVKDQVSKDGIALNVSNRHTLAGQVGVATVGVQASLKLLTEIRELHFRVCEGEIIELIFEPFGVKLGFPKIADSFDSPVCPESLHWRITVQTVLAAEVSQNCIGLIELQVSDHDNWNLSSGPEPFSLTF